MICTMPFTTVCPQCFASINVKKAECVCGHTFCKWRSISTKESKKRALKRKRELQPEGTASIRRV